MSSRLVARNVLVTVATQVLSWAMTFAVTLYLPRYVGDTGLGKLAFATAWVGLFAVCVPLGTSTVLVKEIARDRSRAGELVAGALALRLPIGLLMCAVAYGGVRLLGYPPVTSTLVAVTSAGALLASLNDALSSALGGMEKMPRQSIAVLAEKVLSSGLTIFLVLQRAPLWAIAAVAICSGLVSLAVNLTAFGPMFRTLQWPSGETLRYLVVAGLPFMGWTVFRSLYGQTDPVVLSLVANDQTVGWYAAAFRLTGSSLFLPAALSAALLPTLARLHRDDREAFRQLARRMLSLCMLCGIPISLILICMPGQLLALLHYPPEFRASIPVLQIGGFGVMLWYAAMALGTTVIAADGQVGMAKASAVSTALGVPLCVVGSMLGHRLLNNGAVGAMASDVTLEFFLILMYLRMLPAGTLDFSSLREIGRCALSSVPMLCFLLVALPLAPPLWLVVPSVSIYLVSCYYLRCFDPRFLSMARAALTRKGNPS